MPPSSQERARVVIAGAGVAGLETALALQAFAPERTAVELIDPRERFRLAATATGRSFGIGSGVDAQLSTLAARTGAGLRPGRLAAVDPARHVAMLAGGELVTYDFLVVAVGARAEAELGEALTFTGHAESAEVRALVDQMAATAPRGGRTDLALVVPAGCGWPLPAYELALLTRAGLADRGHPDPGRVTIVTAEEAPLALFGPEASAQVGRSLREAGVEVRPGSVVRDWRWGRLELAGADPLPADRVIALPALRGPALEGLPSDARGFVRSAPDGTVADVPDVWAVGDAGSFPVKQGGIACQQADAAAAAIARRLGADVGPMPFEPVLRGWMWDGAGGLFLRADLRDGHDESTGAADARPLWWPVAKVAGRFLAPLLHGGPE
ncbi:MAG TPA: FAD-dependent oxidoreductase, partial [Miltoncostaeaceae bacterium]|nr:FAD-dependent oxidoreductase [Miltoncostaeaceae bacterium]